jgi:hypothetical protein
MAPCVPWLAEGVCNRLRVNIAAGHPSWHDHPECIEHGGGIDDLLRDDASYGWKIACRCRKHPAMLDAMPPIAL